MSDERRSAKLHKQTEVEVDDAGDEAHRESTTTSTTATAVSGGIPTPTIQSASSSSGTSPDETQPKTPLTRKQTLIRGIALEGTSPPPESFFSQMPPNGAVQDSRLLINGATGTTADKNGKIKGQSQEAKEFLLTSHKISNDSGHGTIDHNDGASDTSVLSRDPSLENASVSDVYKDSSGVNIPKFMKDTLQKSPKDRKTILSYEDQLLNFVNNESAQTLKMAEMTSYDRMIVHRLAAFLGLDHNVDVSGKCVILSRTENTRSVKLSDRILLEDAEQEPKKKILLKKPASLDEKHSRNKAPLASTRAKSLEERQQNYIEARERIFNKNDENQPDGAIAATNLLTANYMPQIYHQRSLDSMKSSSQYSSNKWLSTESSSYGTEYSLNGARLRAGMTKTNSYGGISTVPNVPHQGMGMRRTHSLSKAESLKDSPNAHYGSPPILQTGYQPPPPISTPSDHQQLSRTTPEAGPSPVIQSLPCAQYAYLVSSDYNSIPVGSLIINPMTMQPHINADGSFYYFDPTCPPPFMIQPQTQAPPTHIVYQSENISDLAARLAVSSMGSVDQGTEAFAAGLPGQAIPIMPTIIPHIQSVYASPHPSQFTQGQYFAAPTPVGQQPVRYVAFSYPQAQGHPILQATPVDGQGQTTVPMPAIRIPAVPGTGGYQIVGSPYQQPMAGGSTPQCVDFSPATYHYGPVSEAMMINRTGCHSTAATMGAAPHLILTYSQPQPTQQPQQQHTILPGHQTQFTSTVGSSQGSYYTVPVSTPTPPLTLTQPPPSSHHHQLQQHQPTVYYTTSLGNPITYPVAPSNTLSSTSTIKSVPTTPYIQTPYRSSTPPQQQQIHHLHSQQPQSTMLTPSNGHHPAQLTLNYSHPVPYSPGQPMAPVAAPQGSQLVAFQSNSYQARPVGTALIQLAGNPVVQTPQPGTAAQVQSYQLLKPTGSLPDVRIVNPSTVRPRLSVVASPSSQQPRSKSNSQYRQNKKGGKKSLSSREVDDYQGAQGAPIPQQTGHMITPHSLPGPMPQLQSHLPSVPSNRQ